MAYTKIAQWSTDLETTFGTTQAYSWLDQRFIRETGGLNLIDMVLPDMSSTARLHEENAHVLGSKFGSGATLQAYLDGLANADVLDDGAVYSFPQANISQPIRALMGGASGDEGSVVDTGGGAVDSITVPAGEGARFAEGAAFGVVLAGVVEVRRIVDITGDVIKPHMEFSAIAANGAKVYNSETMYLDEDNVGGDGDSLACRFMGKLTNDQWIMYGCGGSFTIGMAINELLTATFNLQCADWLKTTGGSLGATYAGGGPLPVRLAEVQYATAATNNTPVSRALLTGVEAFNADPGLVTEPQPGISGIETVERWRMMNAVTKATMTVRGHANFDTFWTDFAAKTQKSIGFQIGNTTDTGGTGIVYIHLPRTQFAVEPKRVEAGGFVKAELEYDGMEDAATGATSDIGLSKIIIAVL